MTVKLKTPSNGSVSLTPQDTASDVVVTVPAGTSTMVTNATLPTQLNASGSAPIYACRAWVNFNGTGTVAIRASGNVSSITDNGTGDYTVNFTTAMPDADYVVSCSWAEDNLNTVTGGTPGGRFVNNYATGSVRVHPVQNLGNSTFSDVLICTVAVFR